MNTQNFQSFLQEAAAQKQAQLAELDEQAALKTLADVRSHLDLFFDRWNNGGASIVDLLALHFYFTVGISNPEWKALADACEKRDETLRNESEYLRNLVQR